MAKSAKKEKKNKQAEEKLEPQETPKAEKIIEPLATADPAQAAGGHEEVAEKHLEDESMLMDLSIISVPESPMQVAVDPPKELLPLSPIAPLAGPAKDSTFSPVVDTSIHDARPNIDTTSGAGNVFGTPKASVSSSRTSRAAVALRTSTPYVQKLKLHRTPTGSTPAASPLVKNATFPVEAAEDDSVEFKPVNALEKSILKSSRRKRSMSVADGESFMQKRVMFNSPKFMEIEKIDVKMMASFIEEKENSVMKKNKDAQRRRSHSIGSGTPSKQKERPQSRPKMPNFKAIHEQQFEKMESIADHAQRKAERAKKLTTPSREMEPKRPKLQAISRIPKRQGLKQESPTESDSRGLTRSFSAAPSSKKKLQLALSAPMSLAGSSSSVAGASKSVAGSSKAVTGASTSVKGSSTSALQRSNSETAKAGGSPWAPKVQVTAASFLGPKKDVGTSSGISQKINKVDDRRVKNKALFKGKVVLDARAKNGALLKGVRLNRRFELQMQHRRNTDDK